MRQWHFQDDSLIQYLAREIVRAILLCIVLWFAGLVLMRAGQPAIQPISDMYWG